jgi:hypothetical protein
LLNFNNEKNMALGAIIAGGQAVKSVLFSGPPKKVRKTDAGKFIQKLTTSGSIPDQTSNAVPITFDKSNSSGVSGTLQFGQNQRKNLLPFALIGGLVAVIYFIFGGKKGRRRR